MYGTGIELRIDELAGKLGASAATARPEQLKIDGTHDPDAHVVKATVTFELSPYQASVVWPRLAYGRAVRVLLVPSANDLEDELVLAIAGKVEGIATSTKTDSEGSETVVQARTVKGTHGRVILDGDVVPMNRPDGQTTIEGALRALTDLGPVTVSATIDGKRTEVDFPATDAEPSTHPDETV